MSTFDGRVREYPFIWIDAFKENGTAKYYFLSHAHSDHMRGLEEGNFNKNVYCTEQTARLVPLIKNRDGRLLYHFMKDKLIPVRYNEAFTLPYKDDKGRDAEVEVRFLPANHCIGSAMILIQKPGGGYPVLYTGDTRAEPDFYERSLRKIVKSIRIKNLYMDTTCCDERKETFVSKSKSVRLLIDFIKERPDHQKFFLNTWTFGYEEIWAVLSDTFQTKIHVTKDKYEMYCTADESYKEYLTTDGSVTRFHACAWDKSCRQYEPCTIAIHPSQKTATRMVELEPNLLHRVLIKTSLPHPCFMKEHWMLPFSFHSSLSEIVAFGKFVNPLMLTPCVARSGYVSFDEIRMTLIRNGLNVINNTHSSEVTTTLTTTSVSTGQMSRTATDPESPSTDESMTKSASIWSTRQKTQIVATTSSSRKTRRTSSTSTSSQEALADTTNGDTYLIPKKSEQKHIKSRSKRSASPSLSTSASSCEKSPSHGECKRNRSPSPTSASFNGPYRRKSSIERRSKRSKSTSRSSSLITSTELPALRHQEQQQQHSEADNEASTLENEEKPLGETAELPLIHYTITSQYSYGPPLHHSEEESIIVLSSDDEDNSYSNIKVHKNLFRQLQKLIVRREDREKVFGPYFKPPKAD